MEGIRQTTRLLNQNNRSSTHLLGFPIQRKLAKGLEPVLVSRIIARRRVHRIHSIPRLGFSGESNKVRVEPPSLMGVVRTLGGIGM